MHLLQPLLGGDGLGGEAVLRLSAAQRAAAGALLFRLPFLPLERLPLATCCPLSHLRTPRERPPV